MSDNVEIICMGGNGLQEVNKILAKIVLKKLSEAENETKEQPPKP